MFCKQCGKEIPEGAKFCKSCGTPVPKGRETPKQADNVDNETGERAVATKKPFHKKLWIIVGAAAAAVLVMCFVILPMLNGKQAAGKEPELYPMRVDFIDANGEEDHAYGFVDRKGNWVVEPIYSEVAPYSEGMAWAHYYDFDGDESWTGFLDETGELAFKLDGAMEIMGFHEGLCGVQVKRGIGYIDKTGEWAIEPQFPGANMFSEGLAPVIDKDSELWGYIDKTGKWVIEPQYVRADLFHEGRAAACIQSDTGEYTDGYIDQTGKWVIEPQVWDAYAFSEGLAYVSDLEKRFYIDETGERVIEWPNVIGEFEILALHSDGLMAWTGVFVDGLAAAGSPETGLFGYIDKTGEYAIEPQFRDVGLFSEGLAVAQSAENERYGVIDQTGKWVVEPKYISVSPPFFYYIESNGGFSKGRFWNGLLYVEDEKGGLYIDKQGNEIRPKEIPGMILPGAPSALPTASASPTASTASLEDVVEESTLNALTLPVGIVYGMYVNDGLEFPTGKLSSEYIDSYLFGYVNQENYRSRQSGGAPGLSFPEQVKLTPDETKQILASAFGSDKVDLGSYMPNGMSVAFYNGDYYVGVTDPGSVWAEYQGSVPAAYSETTELKYGCIADYSAPTDVVKIKIEKDSGSDYGYIITAFATEAASTGKSAAAGAEITGNFDQDGFLIADSSQRYLTRADIDSLISKSTLPPKETLGYARNEIFARYGNEFETAKYRDHYSQYDWYSSLPKRKINYVDMSDIDVQNVELIKSMEALY